MVEVAAGGEGLPMRNAAKRNSTTRTGRATNRLGRLASITHGLHGTNWASRFTYSWLKDLKIYRPTATVRDLLRYASA